MKRLPSLAVLGLLLTGCATITQPRTTDNVATAELRDAQGRNTGTAVLTEVPGGLRIIVETKGLPAGVKAVHIHEIGKCEGPQFDSAGGHFNPEKKQHGLMNPQGPHTGDLPNMTVEAGGAGRLETTTDRVTLGSGPTSVFDADGSAIVIHAAPDDFKTDPTGNSGPRIACGVIVKKKS